MDILSDGSLAPATWVRLTREVNAIAPYRWRVEYKDQGRIRQFEPLGRGAITADVDCRRARRLVLEGLPVGEVGLEARVDRPPLEVIIRGRNRMSLRPDGRLARFRWILFGFRYPDGIEDVLQIDMAKGRVEPYRGAPIGAAV